jgi:SAM-dependent methyltransferase
MSGNRNESVIAGFGDEWSRFTQTALTDSERQEIFDQYFAIFPWSDISTDSLGADFGCGSGRWASVAAPRVGRLICLDPSEAALNVARKNLASNENVEFILGDVTSNPIPTESLDFGYSLGVLHHVPDTQAALDSCVSRLKPGAPFLLYLYYAFDNRPLWFRGIWKISDWIRTGVSRFPYRIRYVVSQSIAAFIYWPLARTAKVVERLGAGSSNFPLFFYRDRSFYVMRTDALDRFGTSLEQRFTRKQIKAMMKNSGMERISFSEGAPYWCAVGYKALNP